MDKIILNESDNHFGGATHEFLVKIDERFMKRVVYKLTGDNDGEIYKPPVVKRHDEKTYDNYRLDTMSWYAMGVLNLNNDERDCGPLLGLYDHKGMLTSFWYGSLDMDYIAAIHKAWGAWYEHNHYVVLYGGIEEYASETFEVEYETAS